MEYWRPGIDVIITDTGYKLIVGSNSMNIFIYLYIYYVFIHILKCFRLKNQ